MTSANVTPARWRISAAEPIAKSTVVVPSEATSERPCSSMLEMPDRFKYRWPFIVQVLARAKRGPYRVGEHCMLADTSRAGLLPSTLVVSKSAVTVGPFRVAPTPVLAGSDGSFQRSNHASRAALRSSYESAIS